MEQFGYCVSLIQGKRKCEKQCFQCESYYATLEKELHMLIVIKEHEKVVKKAEMELDKLNKAGWDLHTQLIAMTDLRKISKI